MVAIHAVEFPVTVCLGGGDGGEICVKMEITDEEYELLKQCCRDGCDIESCPELEDLCNRITEESGDETERRMDECDSGEDIDYDSTYYIIEMPEEIEDLILAEEEAEAEREEAEEMREQERKEKEEREKKEQAKKEKAAGKKATTEKKQRKANSWQFLVLPH